MGREFVELNLQREDEKSILFLFAQRVS